MEYKYKLSYPLISKRVKQAREAVSLTQAELAERVDITTNAIAQMETDRMRPKLRTLVNIANVLQCDINYFLCEDWERDAEADELDLALASRLQGLSDKDKVFLIHIIDGLRKHDLDP